MLQTLPLELLEMIALYLDIQSCLTLLVTHRDFACLDQERIWNRLYPGGKRMYFLARRSIIQSKADNIELLSSCILPWTISGHRLLSQDGVWYQFQDGRLVDSKGQCKKEYRDFLDLAGISGSCLVQLGARHDPPFAIHRAAYLARNEMGHLAILTARNELYILIQPVAKFLQDDNNPQWREFILPFEEWLLGWSFDGQAVLHLCSSQRRITWNERDGPIEYPSWLYLTVIDDQLYYLKEDGLMRSWPNGRVVLAAQLAVYPVPQQLPLLINQEGWVSDLNNFLAEEAGRPSVFLVRTQLSRNKDHIAPEYFSFNTPYEEYFEWNTGQAQPHHFVELNGARILPASSTSNVIGVSRRKLFNPVTATGGYLPRSKRDEWGPVGLSGELYVKDNGQCRVGQRCDCRDGIAVPGKMWLVVARKTNSLIKIRYC